ncbi:MAG: DUF1592 domain-containing protein [Nevskiaceae bacterium]
MKRLTRMACAAFAALLLVACGSREPATRGGPPTLRLLTESQYRNTIADVFGDHIEVAARFDPIVRVEGLLAIGAGRATVTPFGVERYIALARAIATQVLAEGNRELLVPCRPANTAVFDADCAGRFMAQTGRYLFRRPLAAAEKAAFVQLAERAAASRGNFHDGLAYGLQAMLASPEFLFVAENVVTDEAGNPQLDGYSRATRLSLFLWNTTPDEALLAAAERGELDDMRGIRRQAERMMASTRFETGVRAFFTDMLALDDFQTLEKDSSLYPAFSLAVANDAREQVLRTLVEMLLVREEDYRDIFTTRQTVMSGPLGLVYRVPAASPSGGWVPFEFPEGDPRAGIQTQLSFVALHSHPGKSSPTLRGKAIRELLLCQRVPDPPGSVNFDLFNDTNSPSKTARDRLVRHSTDPSCSGCHKLMDPIGLALENFDGAGQQRLYENGELIDTSGEINGMRFTDSAGLGTALRDDPAVPACLVRRAYTYAAGRPIQRSERKLLNHFEDEFAAEDFRLPELISAIATSDALYAVSVAPVRTALLDRKEPRT